MVPADPSAAGAPAPTGPGRVLPGLLVVAGLVGTAWAVSAAFDAVSALVVAVVLGALWANIPGVATKHRAGVDFAARSLLRVGIVVLGLRLSLGEIGDLGAAGVVMVAVTVAATFFGTQALGRRLGLDADLSLLVATGYSICGASAIAAMAPVVAHDARDEDAHGSHVAAAIGLVTLFGSLSIVVLPALGGAIGLAPADLGSWIGASTHDVAQVIAAASTTGATALHGALVVKLTRVVLLAPLVAGVTATRRRGAAVTDQPPLLPWFVGGFLVAAVVRSTGVLPAVAIDVAGVVESLLLTAAMVGLGAGVRGAVLRSLGWRPLVLGAVAWVLVAGVALAGVALS